MHTSLLAGLSILLFGATLIAAENPQRMIEQRCAACHEWAHSKEAIASRRTEMQARLGRNDEHIVGRLSGGELLVLRRWLKTAKRVPETRAAEQYGQKRSDGGASWLEYRKPVDTTTAGVGPFTPCELGCDDPMPTFESPRCRACEQPASLSGSRAKALRDIGLRCGRCHQWATRPHLIVREHARIIPRIIEGHGIRRLDRHRRQFLLKAFRPAFVERWQDK